MIDAADLRSLCLLSVRPAGAAEPYSSPPLIGGGPRSSSGSLVKFAAIRRASSRVAIFGLVTNGIKHLARFGCTLTTVVARLSPAA